MSKRRLTARRSLSFVQGHVDQEMLAASLDKDLPNLEFRKEFWKKVLWEQPSAEFRMSVMNRTLSFWVSAFNRWAKNLKAVPEVDSKGLGEMLKLAPNISEKLMERFLKSNPNAKPGAKKTVSAYAVLVAGIFTSQHIIREMKLRYVFALFDFDQSEELCLAEFVMVVKSAYLGLMMAYGCPAEGVPTTAETEKIGKKLFKKVTGSDPARLTYVELTNWFFESNESAALPWQLLLWRHCPKRFGEAGHAVDNAVSDIFVLDKKSPQPMKKVACPLHGEDINSCNIPKRDEILLLHTYYEALWQFIKASPNTNIIQATQHLREMPAECDIDESCSKLMECVAHVLFQKREETEEIGFEKLVRTIFPCVLERHIRAFEYWVTKEKDGGKLQGQGEELLDMRQKMIERSNLPTVSPDDLLRYEREFERLDKSNDGFIDMDELLESGLEVSAEDLQSAIQLIDSDRDGVLDQDEFVDLMCELEGVKLPEGPERCSKSGAKKKAKSARQIFGKWIGKMTKREEMQKRGSNATGGIETPHALRPEAAPTKLRKWDEEFKRLDHDGDGFITVEDLKKERSLAGFDLSFFIQQMDKNGDDRVSREEFIENLCMAAGVRANFDVINDRFMGA